MQTEPTLSQEEQEIKSRYRINILKSINRMNLRNLKILQDVANALASISEQNNSLNKTES